MNRIINCVFVGVSCVYNLISLLEANNGNGNYGEVSSREAAISNEPNLEDSSAPENQQFLSPTPQTKSTSSKLENEDSQQSKDVNADEKLSQSANDEVDVVSDVESRKSDVDISHENEEDADEISSPLDLPESRTDSQIEQLKRELFDQHKQLLERRQGALHTNIQLQTLLSEHFRRRRVDASDIAHSNVDSMASSVIDSGIDYTSRYSKHVETLVQLRKQFDEQKERVEKEISVMEQLCGRKLAEARNEQSQLVEFILTQGKTAISMKTGRPLAVENYKTLIEAWKKKLTAVSEERLENLKLRRQMDKINAAFKNYDLSESLHLIDFEQMKIENQTYNEKIEERNEETNKLRRKIMNTVQMIAHSKEKLQSCQAQNSHLREQLNLWVDKLSSGRDELSKLKQQRLDLKKTHTALIKASGLLGRPEMLRGYQNSVDEVEAKERDILQLKQQTQRLRMSTKTYAEKIADTREKQQGAQKNPTY